MGLTHAQADCLDCAWSADSLNAMVLAAKHHRKTGHQVMIERCFSKIFLRMTTDKGKTEEVKKSV